MLTAVFGTFTIRLAIVFGAVKGDREATSLTLEVLEQERLAIVLGFSVSTTFFNLLHFVAEPRLNEFVVVVVVFLALVHHFGVL